MPPPNTRWERLATLQRLLRRIEHARLCSLNAKDSELKLQEGKLMEGLASDRGVAFYCAVLEPALKSAGRERDDLKTKIADQSVTMREKENRVKLAERMAETDKAELDRQETENQLHEIANWSLSGGKVSAP